MSDTCCETHDGPHLHGCVRPKVAGATHPGICLTSLDGDDQ